eukprot:6180370-Pleurochrysis_carterae.AAC.2
MRSAGTEPKPANKKMQEAKGASRLGRQGCPPRPNIAIRISKARCTKLVNGESRYLFQCCDAASRKGRIASAECTAPAFRKTVHRLVFIVTKEALVPTCHARPAWKADI